MSKPSFFRTIDGSRASYIELPRIKGPKYHKMDQTLQFLQKMTAVKLFTTLITFQKA